MKPKAQKEVGFPKVPSNYGATDINTAQDQKVLPRQIFTGGTLPGNTVMNVGASNLSVDGKNKKFSVYDATGVEVVRIGQLADGTWGIIVVGGTITGGTIQTATSGQRIVIYTDDPNFPGSGAVLNAYDANGILRTSLSNALLALYDETGTEQGVLQGVYSFESTPLSNPGLFFDTKNITIATSLDPTVTDHVNINVSGSITATDVINGNATVTADAFAVNTILGPVQGASGLFTTSDSKTVFVTNGIIVDIV